MSVCTQHKPGEHFASCITQPLCKAPHPDNPMMCIRYEGHEGDHSVGYMCSQRRWNGQPIRSTWSQ